MTLMMLVEANLEVHHNIKKGKKLTNNKWRIPLGLQSEVSQSS